MARHCIHCGNQLEQGAGFCVECGSPVTQVTPAARKATVKAEAGAAESIPQSAESAPVAGQPVQAQWQPNQFQPVAYPCQPFVYPRPRGTGFNVARWLLVGFCALVILSGFLPFTVEDHLWLRDGIPLVWLRAALAALGAMTIAVYGRRMAFVVAAGLMAIAAGVPIHDLTHMARESVGPYLTVVAATFGLVCAIVAAVLAAPGEAATQQQRALNPQEPPRPRLNPAHWLMIAVAGLLFVGTALPTGIFDQGLWMNHAPWDVQEHLAYWGPVLVLAPAAAVTVVAAFRQRLAPLFSAGFFLLLLCAIILIIEQLYSDGSGRARGGSGLAYAVTLAVLAFVGAVCAVVASCLPSRR
jgi:hypothetical protein